MANTQRGFGLAAAVPQDVIVAAAAAVQERGYHSFWLNNPPGADALPPLGAVAARVAALWLGVGVIPLASRGPEEIVRGVRQHDLPLDRIYLGIGSGGGPGGVERVARGIEVIRSGLDCPLVIGALGPKMCRLAGARGDGVLLNWLTPQFARRATAWVREGAEGAGRPRPRLLAYVRVALGDAALSRLRREAASYEAIPQYAAHFARMGASGLDTAVAGGTAAELQEGLAAWNGVVDEVVVRAITASDTLGDVRALLDAAAPQPGDPP
jgi:alkanesulfonate monooxygenase SsuD/methylene tetrahydromethanopterin reductase-like flavin-dependent oxidoreductase (luciferase family)